MQRMIFWSVKIEADYQILARVQNLVIINKKQRACGVMGFSVLEENTVKIKESRKTDNYLELLRELRKLWKMRVSVITIIIDAFKTFSKGLENGMKKFRIRQRMKTMQNTALLEES